MKHISLLIVILLAFSCNKKPSKDSVFYYLPEEKLLEEGVVGKYYSHYFPDGSSSEPSTNVVYILFQKEAENSYSLSTYNAGFVISEKSVYSEEDGLLKLDSSVSFYGYSNLDTMISEIRSPNHSSWSSSASVGEGLLEFMDFDGDQYEVLRTQKRSIDSLINGKPARVIIGDRKVTSINRDTTSTTQYAYTFVQGLGLYNSLSSRPNGQFVRELVEQMPIEEFKKRSTHKKQRVAYIDPDNVLDMDSDFSICGDEKRIADYYNSSPRVDYKDGKGKMMRIIRSKLEREKLNGESGYLTFRFVVNCDGKAGRYVMEQSSLNYTKKRFKRQTIDHLYLITKGLKNWNPSVIRDEQRDAYAYLTYKLQNGVVTDVLP